MKIIVSVYDKAVGCFNNPISAMSRGEAMRSFGDEAANPQTPIAKHPEDFILFEIATFNPSSGEILPIEPDKICSGLDFVSDLDA